MTTEIQKNIHCEEIEIQVARNVIKGDLCMPPDASGVVIVAHGAGSSRKSPRNQYVAQILQGAGLATLLMDLLSEEEEQVDMYTRKLRFDIPLLAGRVDTAADWIKNNNRTAELPIGFFGASTGAAAALIASIQRPDSVRAIVSRGGRPDLAGNVLPEVKPPTLLIVGARDQEVLEKNQESLKKLNTEKSLVIVPGATHLFEEPGKLDEVAGHARRWFLKHLSEEKNPHPGNDSKTHVDAYSFGQITVNGEEYENDLIAYPDAVQTGWRRQESHILRTGDLQEVLDSAPDHLIVGTGASGRMQLTPETRTDLKNRHIRCTEAPTDEAVQLFNEEVEKGVNAAGAFHLTC